MDGMVAAQVEVASASGRLPRRQREALSLHEDDGLSYGEIAEAMGMSSGSVAMLIAHARINLYDELRGTVLASVAPSAECERALALIAAREDDELDPESGDTTWLEAHLFGCGRCRRAVAEMGEVHAYGRARRGRAARWLRRLPRRRAGAAAGLAALLAGAGAAAAFVGGGVLGTPADPAAGVAAPGAAANGAAGRPAQGGGDGRDAKKEKRQQSKGKGRASGGAGATEGGLAATTAGAVVPAPSPAPVQTAGGGDGGRPPASGPRRPSGQAAVGPPRPTSTRRPARRKPPPSRTTTAVPAPVAIPAPAPDPAPEPEEPPRGKDAKESARPAAPPGKPADRPPK